MSIKTLIAMFATVAASFAAPTIAQAAREKPAMQTATPKPSKSGHAAVNGVNYYYAVYGRGEPLLLLHGGLGQIEMFGPNLTKLAQSRQVIGVDLEGHGRTPLGDHELSLVDMGNDMIVGTHGRKGFQKAMLGSVAEAIFRQARCPVLTVGPGVSSKVRSTAELNRILYATDFSIESLVAAPYAISLAREHRAQLILLHLIEKANDEEVKSLRHTLADLVPFGADLRTEPDCIVERGAPTAKILEVAQGHGADLIVLGVRGSKVYPPTVTRLVHSGSYRIVAEAACPVLTVRG